MCLLISSNYIVYLMSVFFVCLYLTLRSTFFEWLTGEILGYKFYLISHVTAFVLTKENETYAILTVIFPFLPSLLFCGS